MKVHELIKKLQGYDSEANIVVKVHDHSYREAHVYLADAIYNTEYGDLLEYHDIVGLEVGDTKISVVVVE